MQKVWEARRAMGDTDAIRNNAAKEQCSEGDNAKSVGSGSEAKRARGFGQVIPEQSHDERLGTVEDLIVECREVQCKTKMDGLYRRVGQVIPEQSHASKLPIELGGIDSI